MNKIHTKIDQDFQRMIDTHCHLDSLSISIEEALTACAEQAVDYMITISVSPDNLDTVLSLAQSHPNVYGSQGIHPHDAQHFNAAVEATIRKNAQHNKILAIGEIGLDYYYMQSDKDVQKQVFAQQLEIAIDMALPVVIHTRAADEDTIAILKQYASRLPKKGVIHSFTAGQALADYCLEQGFYLGFNGIITFKNADNVRAILENTPISRILTETDAPYLTPVPHRGAQNAPHYLPLVAQKIAEVKQIALKELLGCCYQNAIECFSMPIDEIKF